MKGTGADWTGGSRLYTHTHKSSLGQPWESPSEAMQQNFWRLPQLDPGSGVVEETNSLAYFEGLSVRIAGTVIIGT